MTKAVLYPFSRESLCIIHNFYLSDYEITIAVISGKLPKHCLTMSYFDDFPNNKIPISNDFYQSIKETNTIIWAPYTYNNKCFYHEVIVDISRAIEQEKNIVCLETLSKDILEHFLSLAEVYHVDFRYLNANSELYTLKLLDFPEKIDVPVITVAGIAEDMDKFETQLYIRETFLLEGYIVSQIGSKPYSDFFHIHPYPSFMFDNQFSEKQKILNFNRYIFEIAEKEKPDIFIIGIPGDMGNFHENYISNFGIELYLSSNAYQSDFTVLTIACEKFDSQYVNKMKDIFNYRFSMPLDCMFISNVRIEKESLKYKTNKISMDILPKKSFEEVKKSCKENSQIPIFDIRDKKSDFKKLVDITLA